MMGLGFLMMFAVLAVPILLVLGIIWLWLKENAQRSSPQPVQGPATHQAGVCSHCQASLQLDWTHCPRCGAPVGA